MLSTRISDGWSLYEVHVQRDWQRTVRLAAIHCDGRHIVHVDDVIHAVDLALGHPSAIGQTFNIAGPAPFDYRTAAMVNSIRKIASVQSSSSLIFG